jgi:AcrR family transcriptional regulator
MTKSTPLRSLRAEQVEATRQAIIASARKLFGARGYSATSVDDVAADARVTKGAVYHHFATKDDLFRAVYSEVEAAAQARVGRLATGGSAIDVLVAGIHAYLDAALDPEIQRITLIDGPAVLGLEPEGPADELPGHQSLRAFVSGAVADGSLQNLDPASITHMISGACLQGGLVIARARDQRAARKRVGAVIEAMIRGLGADAQTTTRPRRKRAT